MKIGIIGAGFTGLAAAYHLAKDGHEVTIFEKDTSPGGLAVGYQEKNWDWPLERHYHHWFSNDRAVLNLAKEIGHPVLTKRINTSVYLDNKFYQLDSPQKILAFPKLSLFDRLRMGFALGLLKINPFWKPLEKVRAIDVLPNVMGKKAWNLLWWPQLKNKMGKYAESISLVWFWTRITKRTPSVCYPEGGFLNFAKHLAQEIEKLNGKVLLNTEAMGIQDRDMVLVKVKDKKTEKTYQFDRVIVTLPSFLFVKLSKGLPDEYINSLAKLRGLSATNLVLRLKKPFLPDTIYWASICELNCPVMAIIEHTHFMDKRHYDNENIMYIGNYALTDDKLDWDKEKILKLYDPLLLKINSDYKKNLIDYTLFKAPFAQPIVPTNYSKLIPKMTTPLPHVFLANIEQVYPWDRGTNYAVELGEKVAKLISNS